MSKPNAIERVSFRPYRHGFSSKIESDRVPIGLNQGIIRTISAKKHEPEWLLEWRLRAYRHWRALTPPAWQNVKFPPINYAAIRYYAAPKRRALKSLDEIDPEIVRMFNKLGIPLEEQKRISGVAVDAVVDSASVATTFKAELRRLGILFCSMSEAVREYPDLVRQYLGSVVPFGDNYFASLNAAVFSDGSFCYIPRGVHCPMDLSTYFRINSAGTGQFERTLIIAEDDSYVSYLEGCTAPRRNENQLHAAVVEIVAKDRAEVRYATVQNWYPGDANGKGGIYNFVTKRGKCAGCASKISWTQVETGSAITWKYPSVILQGDDSVGEFYSVALTANHQQADTGSKMIHIGKNTRSTIIAKGIAAGRGRNIYRGLVRVLGKARGARNYTQCDSLMLGSQCEAETLPYIEARRGDTELEHEASTTTIREDQLLYLKQRGIDEEQAVSLIINGFGRQVLSRLPLEFAVEARNLLGLRLEGSIA
ncbi:MAG: Fe-S cluster assembly protein SufB [Parcubacteria group bacterium]